MNAYKTRIKFKDLKMVIDAPREIFSPEVEIIILSESEKNKKVKRIKKMKNLGGVFRRYGKPELIDKEKEIAWSKVAEEKNGIL